MNVVKDVVGKPVKIGDIVAFAVEGRGVSGFQHGVVTEFVGAESIRIESKDAHWSYDGLLETIRKDGQFAIVEGVYE